MVYKYDFRHITLMWRPGKGHRRIHVGDLSVHKDGLLEFTYIPAGIDEAKRIDPNFCGYPGISLQSKSISTAQISEVFFGRLINPARNDAEDLYDFWLVDKNRLDDSLYILAQTQGLSFSDMFEFVPQYYSSHKPSFITDIAGLSKIDFDLSKLHKGDALSFTLEKDNPVDKEAVYVSHDGLKIGYIKKGHNKVFNRKNTKGIRVTVWFVNNSPGFESLYVRVDF